jgi:uncharacterized protein YdeI (YjbR/CyaY-like superfamily)
MLLMPSAKPVSRSFDAVLEHSGNSLNWIIIRVPVDVAKVWGKRGQLKVKGEINGFPFRTSLFPTGKGTHFIIVNKKMQQGGKTAPGMKARFRMQPDDSPRVVAPPPELERVLRQSKKLQKFFESLNNSSRREIAKWIQAGKAAETRKRRAEELAERLMATMEAERELPPVLQAALAHNPKAQAGWELMPPSHRRNHLMAIFYYKNPESRARRVQKAVEMMLEYAEKREGKIRREE